ncbi:MAG TPA: carboxypeptidase-like regulatory domain-containing protein [Polyangiales bacterium]
MTALGMCIVASLGAPSAALADSEACLSAHEKAQIERMHGRYVEAHAQLLECAQAACPAVVRSDCKGWLSEVEGSLPSVVFAVSDSGGRDLSEVRVSAGGKLLTERADGRSLPLNPGKYTLRFDAPGYVTREQEVLVREAEKQRIIRVQLDAEPAALAPTPLAEDVRVSDASPESPRSRRLLLASYVLGGATLASLGVGIGFGVSGNKMKKDLEGQDCSPDCSPSEVEAGKKRYVIANVAFAMAGAFGVSAVVTLLLGLRARNDVAAPSVALGPHGGSVHWRLRF